MNDVNTADGDNRIGRLSDAALLRRIGGIQKGNFDDLLILDYQELGKIVEMLKMMGEKVVATQGAFDFLHRGHSRYLRAAKSHGTVLVVGLDSDAKVRKRKPDEPMRPLVPQDERVEMLLHTRWVNIVAIKNVEDEPFLFMKTVKPDVLIISESTKDYSEDEIEARRKYCGEVVLLPPQSSNSTTAKIRQLWIGKLEEFTSWLNEAIRQKLGEIVGRN